MFKFLKDLMLDFLYGEKFEVTVEDVKLWMKIDGILDGFPLNRVPTTTVTGDDVYIIGMQLPSQLCWANTKKLEEGINNLIVPDLVLHFLKNGGTLKEIDNYKTVIKYGMLHGKKRRLVIS